MTDQFESNPARGSLVVAVLSIPGLANRCTHIFIWPNTTPNHAPPPKSSGWGCVARNVQGAPQLPAYMVGQGGGVRGYIFRGGFGFLREGG